MDVIVTRGRGRGQSETTETCRERNSQKRQTVFVSSLRNFHVLKSQNVKMRTVSPQTTF